jgi:hypothetical protein
VSGGRKAVQVLAGAKSERVLSELERIAMNRIEHGGLPAPVREHRFAPPRMWRFDLAYLSQMVAVELEGGVFSGGRHTRGKGFTGDCRKYSEAAVRGWLVIRCTREMVESGEMVLLLKRALEVPS